MRPHVMQVTRPGGGSLYVKVPRMSVGLGKGGPPLAGLPHGGRRPRGAPGSPGSSPVGSPRRRRRRRTIGRSPGWRRGNARIDAGALVAVRPAEVRVVGQPQIHRRWHAAVLDGQPHDVVDPSLPWEAVSTLFVIATDERAVSVRAIEYRLGMLHRASVREVAEGGRPDHRGERGCSIGRSCARPSPQWMRTDAAGAFVRSACRHGRSGSRIRKLWPRRPSLEYGNAWPRVPRRRVAGSGRQAFRFREGRAHVVILGIRARPARGELSGSELSLGWVGDGKRHRFLRKFCSAIL